MIHKLVHIKNLGKFSNYNSGNNGWNGVFGKITAIYADNGSGKTTFTQIIKSIKENDRELLLKRKSLGSTEPISILFIDKNNKNIKFSTNWNRQINDIEVFDFLFVESNVYLITLGNYDKPGTLFEIVVGDEAVTLYNAIVDFRRQRKQMSSRRKYFRFKLKDADEKESRRLVKLIDETNIRSRELTSNIAFLEKRFETIAEEFGKTYLEKINEYLRYFVPHLKLTKLNKKGTRFVYYIKISDHDVRSDSESISLKHTLSEGEKNSLAFSFFLARLSLKPDISNKLIVFDDPISSLDYNRRNVSINLLTSLARKSNQFILLSHDLHFVKDFSDKFQDCLNLKIIYDGNTSLFASHDIKYETLTGIFKDMSVLDSFIKKGETSEFGKRDVMRCIRPAIEGFFRIKYFNYIDDSHWLGDIIDFIRKSSEGDVFYKQKDNLDELIDINDYSKTYHHSNPNYLEVCINTEELKNYCKRTIELISNI